MGIHAIFYNEEYDEEFGAHELVDIDYTCSYICMQDVIGKLDTSFSNVRQVSGDQNAGTVVFADGSAIEYGAWPCGSETDYDVYCANESCKALLWHGLQSEDELADVEVD